MLNTRSPQVNLTNMFAFDAHGFIKKYTDTRDIVLDYLEPRKQIYGKRKRFQEVVMREKLKKAKNRARFVGMVADTSLKLKGRTRAQLEADLDELGFDRDSNGIAVVDHKDLSEAEEKMAPGSYGYLLSMPIWSCTTERLATLEVSGALGFK